MAFASSWVSRRSDEEMVRVTKAKQPHPGQWRAREAQRWRGGFLVAGVLALGVYALTPAGQTALETHADMLATLAPAPN